MRKPSATITALLIVAAAGMLLVGFAMANPFTNSQYSGTTGAPSGAPNPIVSILHPKNNQAYNTNSFTLNFSATIEKFSEGGYNSPLSSGMEIVESFFTADWLPNQTQIEIAPYFNLEGGSNNVSVSLNLTGVPDGKHALRVYVLAEGIIIDPFHWYNFETVGYSSVNFTVDTYPPSISVLSIGNETHIESGRFDVPLNFAVNESAGNISYVLDGMENVTIDGNTTLSGLSGGVHNLTVYAWDSAGNVGASETVSFTVAETESLPTVLKVAVSAASIAAAAATLVFARRRRRGEAQQT